MKSLSEQLAVHCDSSTYPSLFLLNKGTREPISLTGGLQNNGTVFQLLKFDNNSCSAYFSYIDNLGVTRTFIIDCRLCRHGTTWKQ